MRKFLVCICFLCCVFISCENEPNVNQSVDAVTCNVLLKNNGTETNVTLNAGGKFQIPALENDNHVLLSIQDSNGNHFREGDWITITADTVLLWNWTVDSYSSASDFLYDETSNTVSITGYSGKGGNVVIPEKINNKPVVKIAENAIWENESIISLVIPSTVKEIGNLAIFNCPAIRTLAVDLRNSAYESVGNCIIDRAQKKLVLGCSSSVIPAGGRVESIGSYTFSNTNFNSFNIPEGVKTLDSCALANMEAMESITLPSTLTNIGDVCFTGCSALKSITIPSSVKHIGNGPFQSCTDLAMIDIEAGNTNYRVSGNCLIDKNNVLIAGCSRSTIPTTEGIVEIGNNAFCGISLTSLVLPDTVKRIGDYAFSNCKLNELIIGKQVNYVGKGAFSMWTSPQKLIISKTADKSRWNADWMSDCSADIDIEGEIIVGQVYSDFSIVDEEVGKISYVRYWPGVLKLANGETVKDTKRFYFSKGEGIPIPYKVYVPYTIVDFHREKSLLCDIPITDIIEGWYLKDKLDHNWTADQKFKAIGNITEMPAFDESTIKDKLIVMRKVTRTPASYNDVLGMKFYIGGDIQLEDGTGILSGNSAFVDAEDNSLVLPIVIRDEYEKAGFTNLSSGDPLWRYLHTYYPPNAGEPIWGERKISDIKKTLIELGELKKPKYSDYVK